MVIRVDNVLGMLKAESYSFQMIWDLWNLILDRDTLKIMCYLCSDTTKVDDTMSDGIADQ